MSELYELYQQFHAAIAEGDTDQAGRMIQRAMRAPGSIGPDGGNMLQAEAEAENVTVTAAQMYYDSVRAYAMQPESAGFSLESQIYITNEGFRDMDPNGILYVANAAQNTIRNRLQDEFDYNDGPSEYDPDLTLDITVTDINQNSREIHLDADELLLLGALAAEVGLEEYEAENGADATIAYAEQLLANNGGGFQDNAIIQQTMRDLLADENYTSFNRAYAVGQLAAVEGQLAELNARNDNAVVEVEGPGTTPAPQTTTATPTRCVGC